jgi:DNA-binding transcriptional MocR family regulator
MATVSRTVRGRRARRSGPIYRTLVDEIAGLIERGALRPGDRLPSVRSYARQRRVSVSTVLRVYQVLEDRGQLEVRPQSGHFVAAARTPLPPIPSPGRVSRSREEVRLTDLVWLLYSQLMDPTLVPFGPAAAAPELYPSRRLARILARLARELGPEGIVYGDPHGTEPLRHEILRRALATGYALEPDEVIVTNGCSEAIQLALGALTSPGDTVLIDSPSFFGPLSSAESLGLRTVEMAADSETGVAPEQLETAIRRVKPRLFLTTPNLQNPLGFTVPDEAKRAQVEILARYGVVGVEDDVYGDLHFGERRPRPLKAFDTGGQVILCSSFSKTLAPAYRVGWIAAGAYIDPVRRRKLATSFHTNTLAQFAIAEFLRSGGGEHHLRTLRRTFRAQMADYSHAIGRLFPAGTKVSRPQGGHLLWVELPEGSDATELYRRALARRIGILPGSLFSPGGSYGHCFRLNCGFPLRGRELEALRTLGALATAVGRQGVGR